MKHELKYYLLLGIFLLSLISSALLTFVPLPIICTQFEGCNAVQTSAYAETFGIHNSLIGVIIFAVMSIIIYSQIKKPQKKKEMIINTSIFLGTMISLYFMYLQQFVLHAYCKYCLVVDIGMIVSFVIANISTKEKNKPAAKETNKK